MPERLDLPRNTKIWIISPLLKTGMQTRMSHTPMLYFDQSIILRALDKNHQVQLIDNKVKERVTKHKS